MSKEISPDVSIEELGSVEDLRRISELEIPEINDFGKLLDFLQEHRIAESLATAIAKNGYEDYSDGGFNGYGFKGTKAGLSTFSANINASMEGLTLHIGHNRITPMSELDSSYSLRLPVMSRRHGFGLDTRDRNSGNRLWGVHRSGRDKLRYETLFRDLEPSSSNPGEPVALVMVAKMAAAELAEVISDREARVAKVAETIANL